MDSAVAEEIARKTAAQERAVKKANHMERRQRMRQEQENAGAFFYFFTVTFLVLMLLNSAS
jgi:hypothetical protein